MSQKYTCLTSAQREVVSNLKSGFFLARRINEPGWYYTRGNIRYPVLFGQVRPRTFSKLLAKKIIKKVGWCCKILYYQITENGKEYNN